MEWYAKYIGLPFGEAAGQVTCWSLVKRVYADHMALELPAYGEISARDLVRVARTMEARKDDGWQAVTDPQAFDVCLMRAAGWVCRGPCGRDDRRAARSACRGRFCGSGGAGEAFHGGGSDFGIQEARVTILAVYREPFGIQPHVAYLPEDLTLAELAKRMPHLPHDFADRGTICINGRPVQRNAWRMIKPKPHHNGVPVEVTFHATPMGGSDEGGGGKQILALVASIALIAFTGGIAANGVKFLGIAGGSPLAKALPLALA